MSTDPPVAGRGLARRSRQYRRTLAAVIGVLVLATSGLAVVGLLQGPRLDRATFDPELAIERADARLVLEFDQPVLGDADVTTTPRVDIETETIGDRVVVTFARPLAAETDYRVTAEVVGAGTGRAAVVEHGFSTPRPQVVTLVRDPDGDDLVVRRELRSDTSTTLASAPVIQEFAMLEDAVAFVALDDEQRAELRIAPNGETEDFAVGLPEPGTVTRLDASAGLVAFAFSSELAPGAEPRFVNTLHVYDSAAPNSAPRVVTGLDGEPLQVSDIRFVPGTTSLVVHAFDSSLQLVDALGAAPPTPLGQHSELRGFLPGTAATLVVANPDAGATIDLVTGETATLDLPDFELPAEAYRNDLTTITPDSYVEIVARPRSPQDPYRFEFSVVVVDRDDARILFEPPLPGAAVEDVCVSPNGQYAAITVSPREASFDGVPNVPSVVDVATFVVAIADGRTAGVIPGFAIDWCG